MTVSKAFELLAILDSPLLPLQAPELVPFRDQVLATQEELNQGSCTACQKRIVVAKLAQLQVAVQNCIARDPALAALVPALQASAKMKKS